MKEIIVYTTNLCGYCNAAKMWLQNHGLEFKEINLDKGNEREKFMESYPHLRTSPQIFCEGENIGGFTDLIEVDPEDLK